MGEVELARGGLDALAFGELELGIYLIDWALHRMVLHHWRLPFNRRLPSADGYLNNKRRIFLLDGGNSGIEDGFKTHWSPSVLIRLWVAHIMFLISVTTHFYWFTSVMSLVGG